MATPATFAQSSFTFHSPESQIIDRAGIVCPNTPFPFSEVDVSHLGKIVISDEWGEVNFIELLNDLYTRFENARNSLENVDKTQIFEVGSSAAYDAYNGNREILNNSLPQALKDKAKDMDLHPSFDRDLRYKVNKHLVVRAEEFLLAALSKTCPGFIREKFRWREKVYDINDNICVLSIKDKKNQQYDFYFYEISKRPFFASRDASQLDLTPFVTEGKNAKLIVNDFHPLQPYVDRIERKLIIPEPEKVNHHGFLLQLFYGMKGYVNPDPNAENILKITLLNYLKTHNLNDLISKFISNHPSDNGFAFIFSVRSRLGLSISSPVPGYTPAQLSVCAQLLSPIDKKLHYNGQDYYLNAPAVENLKDFNWKCDLIKGLNVSDVILEFEGREPLNPVAKAMFDSYVASLSDEERSTALKKRVMRFGATDRRSLVVMQTISSTKMKMPPDLLAVVANYADSSQYGLLINEISNVEWIRSNVEKAIQVFHWLLENRNKDRIYPFLKNLIPYCPVDLIEKFVKGAWDVNPNIEQLLSLSELLTSRNLSLRSIFRSQEETMVSQFTSSKDLLSVLGQPQTSVGILTLFRLYAKEDRLAAINYAIESKITDSVLTELLPLFRTTDSTADKALVERIAAGCASDQFDPLINYLPSTWMAALPSKAEEVFNWLISAKKQTSLYPFLHLLLPLCPLIDRNIVYKAWSANPDIAELLKLSERVNLPSLFSSREAEILPYIRGLTSTQFRVVIGEPASNNAKIALYSILCRENPRDAIEFATSQHLPPDVVSQFLTTLEAGSDADRNNLRTYLNSLSYDERIAFWKDWLQKIKSPLESPLFPWVLDELKDKYNQSLFMGIVRHALPQAAHVIANLECVEWINENAPVVTRVLDILAKEKSGAYATFLRRLINEDALANIPAHLKRIWDIEQDITSLCTLQPLLANRGLNLSCVFPSMEKDLAKPFGKALHEIKKLFDDIKFTRLAELCHPSHLDVITQIAITNPLWVTNHADQAFHLFSRLVETGKPSLLQQYLPIFFKHGEASNFQDCVKKAWPLIRKARSFLEFKSVLQSRAVSLSVIFRPLEEDVLKSLEEQKESAATARDFFGAIESSQGKRIYLSLLMRGEMEQAITYAKENRFEVDIMEMSRDSLPVQVLEGKTEWNKDETERLWVLAERTLNIPLVQILLPLSRTGFISVLRGLSANPDTIKRAAVLYPQILKECVTTALPYILAQSQVSDVTRVEIPRILKEATISEKLQLLNWMRVLNHPTDDYVALDIDAYKGEYAERLNEESKFEALYTIVGADPFIRLWNEKNETERVEIVERRPYIFKLEKLKALLNPIKDVIFSRLPIEALESLKVEPSSKSQYLACFSSATLFDRFYPKFYENFGFRKKNLVSVVEYKLVLDYLIKYKSRHILSALGYHADFCEFIIARTREFVDIGVTYLGPMKTQEEVDYYNFAKLQSYVPSEIVQHFIKTNNFEWFKEGLDLLSSIPPNLKENDSFALTVMRGIVRFENEFSAIPGNGIIQTCALIFITGISPQEAFDCLRNASNPVLRNLCLQQILQILKEWKADPKRRTTNVEEQIGKYISDSLAKEDKDVRKFLSSEPFKELASNFPSLSNYYRIQLCEIILKEAKAGTSLDNKLEACKTIITSHADYFFKNPDSAVSLIDLYLSLISEIIDQEGDISKIKCLVYGFFFMFVNPDMINNSQVAVAIPDIKTIKKSKNLAQAVTYITKLLDVLLTKKYPKNTYLYFALDTTQLFLNWLLGKATDYSKQILPLIKKRIYFIPSTPEFHFSEFVLANQKIIPAADSILPHDQKAEYSFASNIKMTENAPKLLPAKIEGFNRYAQNLLNFNCTRPAQHVLNSLAELLPVYKTQNREIRVKEIFSGLITRAAADPKEPTATGVAFLLKVKEVFGEYFKVVRELKPKEREKYINDYLFVATELIKGFYKVCETIPEYMGHYSDFMTMIELENYIDSRYDAYFDICEIVLTQWVKVTEELNGQAMDPMTNLILCQIEKVPEKYRARQSQSMDKWFEVLCKAKKQEYVRFLIDDFPAVTEICTDEMKKKYGAPPK